MDLDQLKNYAAPILALVLVVAWYFFVRPALNDDEPPAEDAQETRQ